MSTWETYLTENRPRFLNELLDQTEPEDVHIPVAAMAESNIVKEPIRITGRLGGYEGRVGSEALARPRPEQQDDDGLPDIQTRDGP